MSSKNLVTVDANCRFEVSLDGSVFLSSPIIYLEIDETEIFGSKAFARPTTTGPM